MPIFAYLLAGIVLGLIFGSFLAALVTRWPKGQSVMKGRSCCDACGHQLGILDLIPVLSHIWQDGKCRSCGVSISKHHLAIELAAALIGGLALFVAPGIEGMAGAILGWLLLGLAALDAEHHWLPDRLIAALAGTGLLNALLVSSPTIVERLIGGLIGYLSLLLIATAYKTIRGRDGLGGGDSKMLGAIGCWLGWQALPLVLLGASAAGLIVLLSMQMRGQKISADSKMPLGSLMAIAAFPLWLVQTAGIRLLS